MSTGSILVVDDEPDLRAVYELALVREGYEVDTAGDVTQARHLLAQNQYQVMITDMRLPDGIGLDLVKMISENARAEKCLVVTAYGSAENAVEALKAGAFDYLTKPVDLKQLRQIVATAMQTGSEKAAALVMASVEAEVNEPTGRGADIQKKVLGHSRVMHEVRNVIAKVAPTMAPVLVHGESGTGKEVVARAIHQCSHRANGPFIAVNCGAIPENLVEAEFFGSKKGSFTGANEDRQGLFSAAAGGTLFLDEIGELPLPMQSKLLRVIQERAVRAIGSNVEESVDVRIISATHRNLSEDVKSGRFRQDLFYRLNVIEVVVPPLRDRGQDVIELAEHVLKKICTESATPTEMIFEPEALDALMHYSFPGNVRELENILQRAVAMSDGFRIRAGDLSLPAQSTYHQASPAVSAAPASSVSAPVHTPYHTAPSMPMGQSDQFTQFDQAIDSASGVSEEQDIKLPTNLTTYLNEIEKEILTKALELHKYNRTAAATQLGLSLRQIRYRMEQLGIDVPDDKN